MNFSSINSPADLVAFNEANKEVKPLPDRIIKMLIEDGNVFDNMPVILYAIESLISFHHRNAEEALTDENAGNPLAWAYDEGKLVAALSLLKQVEMPAPDSHLRK